MPLSTASCLRELGVFWSGIKRSCVRASTEKVPLLLSVVRAPCSLGESPLARLRQDVGGADLSPAGSGLGSLLEDGIVLRCAVSLSVVFCGVRRASGVAALRVSDVRVNDASEGVRISARCRKNEHFGVRQPAHMAAPLLWKGVCPIRLPPRWLRLRERLTVDRNRMGRMSVPENHTPLYSGWAWQRPACPLRGAAPSRPEKAVQGCILRMA